ncbi:MAG: hypothetical protein LBK72_01260, partial [Bifidobacteriaceae bacterium]|nr:hypothetical protein [Bifidobacteriaceae bacterium]
MTRDPAADAASRLPRTASPAEPTAPAADAAAPPRPEPAADAGTRQSPAATPASPITSPGTPLTYAAAGVDTDAGDRAVDLMKSALERGAGPRAIGGVGGFAGLFDARELTSYRHPLLASSTDGVGTKVAIAQAMDIHHTIGIDLVAMVVDDLVVCGATPLVMTDYIATGHVVPER